MIAYDNRDREECEYNERKKCESSRKRNGSSCMKKENRNITSSTFNRTIIIVQREKKIIRENNKL